MNKIFGYDSSGFNQLNVVVNNVFKDSITRHDANSLSKYDRRTSEIIDNFINVLGEESMNAQGINKVITSAEKMRNSNHILYILKDEIGNNGKGEIAGYMKVGEKNLFLYDRSMKLVEQKALCLLDFYVRPPYQRQGCGKHLYDYMLKDQGVKPHQMAIDGPTDKTLLFLKKHYGLDNMMRQANNFAVHESYFEGNVVKPPSRPCSRDGLQTHPMSQIAAILYQTDEDFSKVTKSRFK